VSCVDGQLWALCWSPSQASVGPGLYNAPLAARVQRKDRVQSPPGKYTSSSWAACRKPLGSSCMVPIDTRVSCENNAKDSHQLALLV